MSNAAYEPSDEMVRSEPLGDEDVVLENEPAGAERSRGGGEYPDPDTPPSGSAPADGSPEHGKGDLNEALDGVSEEQAASGS